VCIFNIVFPGKNHFIHVCSGTHLLHFEGVKLKWCKLRDVVYALKGHLETH
jgi:hypothetical protein